MEIPLYGMVQAMSTTINWLTPHGDAVRLMSPKKHQLDMRVAEEYWDVEQAEEGIWADKYDDCPSQEHRSRYDCTDVIRGWLRRIRLRGGSHLSG